ncbi:MAG: thiol oxidoreductase, partial [Gammaproteobacteria bacterium]
QADRGRTDPAGNTLDLPAARLNAITTFLTATQVPVQTPNTVGQRGKKIFADIGCAGCHLPRLRTADGVTFAAYTDLLLHDMGAGLADGRTEGSANGREFRTAPLWGLSTYAKTLASKTPFYLHDGRAKTLEAAILWHGGEAENAKQHFMQLSADKRQALLTFLQQL